MKQRKKTGQERLIFAGMAVCIGVLVYCAFQFSRYIEESRNHQKAREEAVREITISLPAETRRYRIFSVEYAQPDAFNVYTIGFGHDETYAEFIQGFHERALYKTDVEATRADSVLTLSTCSDNGERRFVVHARLESVQPHNS